MSPFLDALRDTPETRVSLSDDGRGHATTAARDFAAGEVIFQEPPLALVYPSRDAAWLASMRAELVALDGALAWQYCVASHCLAAAELPQPLPDGLRGLSDDAAAKLSDLCGAEPGEGGEQPSELARLAAERLLGAAEEASAVAFGSWLQSTAAALPAEQAAAGRAAGGGERERVLQWLADRLDDVAVRASRNGFQIADMSCRPPVSADGLFHRISFFNHCCAGLNNASWVWKGEEGLLTVKATRDVKAGEELTISYIAKPWCDLAKPARRRYLKQNFNFVCLCKACCQPVAADRPSAGAEGSRPAKANSKLASMLVRWMQDEREDAGDAGAAGSSADAAASSQAKAALPEPKLPLTEEQRLERVLLRCSGEGLEVSREEASAALEAESGHVGRALIRLRRGRAAGAQAKAAECPSTLSSPQEGGHLWQAAVAVGLGALALGLARWALRRSA